MKNNDIRRRFLDYFVRYGHAELPSSSVVPHNDPSLLFTSSGMVQFKDIFTGTAARPEPPRAVTAQKCFRAGGKHNDLENVGYTTHHHTFFEMLGNFSFGDYFKDNAIELAWNLITREFDLPAERLLVTVYHDDDEAADLWRRIAGLPEERILRIATSDNFWQMGDTGPCGPCSEMFFDHGDKLPGGPPGTPDEDGPRFIEIWNLVFMQFAQQANGTRVLLPKPSIDTGMGLERVGAVLQGVHDNYDTDSLKRLVEAVGHQLHSDPFGDNAASHKIIADHLRACGFMIADGVLPANEGRGYVLRRILRRALRHAHLLGAREPVMHHLLPTLITEMGDHFSELKRAEALISEILKLESQRFIKTLERGLKLLDAEASALSAGDKLDGGIVFKLYDTFGFPVDLTADILRGRGASVDMIGFDAAMAEQKQRARAAWSGTGAVTTDAVWLAIPDTIETTEFLGYNIEECKATITVIICDGKAVKHITAPAEITLITNQTPFYAESGGQQGDQGTLFAEGSLGVIKDTQKHNGIFAHHAMLQSGSLRVGDGVRLCVNHARRDALRAHHSATHLLHSALREILGEHVMQKGSSVSPEGLRFDFSHNQPLSEAEKIAIEDRINNEVRANTEVVTRIMTPKAAMEAGALALFGEQYGDEVRVICMGTEKDGGIFSLELCGGTHTQRTGDIGFVRLKSEHSTAAGVRRVEAVAAEASVRAVREIDQRLQNIAQGLKIPPNEIEKRLESLLTERAQLKKQLESTQKSAGNIQQSSYGAYTLFSEHRPDTPAKQLKGLADQWRNAGHQGVYAVIATEDDKASVVVAISEDCAEILDAVALVRLASAALGGKGGGGRNTLAQAGGNTTDSAGIRSAFDAIGRHLLGASTSSFSESHICRISSP